MRGFSFRGMLMVGEPVAYCYGNSGFEKSVSAEARLAAEGWVVVK